MVDKRLGGGKKEINIHERREERLQVRQCQMVLQVVR